MKIAMVAIGKLKPNPRNPNHMDTETYAILLKGVKEFGLVQPIIVNKTSGFIVGGHHRWKAAREAGHKQVPVTYVELDSSRELALGLALNNIGGIVNPDEEAKLIAEIKAKSDEAFDMELVGLSLEDVAAACKLAMKGLEPPGEGGNDGTGLGNPVIDYTIVFDNKDQETLFLKFVKYLKKKYKDGSIASRLDQYLSDLDIL